MHLCHQAGGWLTEWGDPDEVAQEAEIRAYLGWGDNATFNSIRHLFAWVDPAERIANRRRQVVQLARYGHAAAADELLGWGDVDLREFEAIYSQLAEVLDGEGAAGATEN